MQPFNFHLATKIVFGQSVQAVLPVELAALDAKSILLVSDAGLLETGMVTAVAETVRAAGLNVDLFTAVSTNPTSDEVAAGLAIARANKSDAVVALGGGSPIDVAKGIGLLLANGGSYADYQWSGKPITRRSWPLIAVPTTAGTGSEVSKVAVITDPSNPFKKGVLSPLMFPHVALVDPALTLGLPAWLTAATGIDAFTHALEAYVGLRANPFTDQLALAAMQTVLRTLPQATKNGADIKARGQMMLAALWGGMAMDHAGLGLIHALSGPLTTHLHLHHGLANGIILPHVMGFNFDAIVAPRRTALCALFGLDTDADGETIAAFLTQFVSDLGLPVRLRQADVDLGHVDWDTIAAETTKMFLIQNNPRRASQQDCRQLLEQML